MVYCDNCGEKIKGNNEQYFVEYCLIRKNKDNNEITKASKQLCKLCYINFKRVISKK